MAVTPGNTKLGRLIWCWSLPTLAIICIGATELCKKLCYAMKGFFRMPSVKDAHYNNYELSLEEEFPQYVSMALSEVFARVVRVHVSGDFYDEAYVRKWLQIVRRRPYIAFYAYTRSWRIPEMLPALKELAKEPNFFMWWSCDQDTGAPPRTKYARRAYLMENDDDVAPYKVDLVFRDKSTTVMKYDPKGNQVCPYDNGVTRTTCSQCKLCFERNPLPRKRAKQLA